MWQGRLNDAEWLDFWTFNSYSHAARHWIQAIQIKMKKKEVLDNFFLHVKLNNITKVIWAFHKLCNNILSIFSTMQWSKFKSVWAIHVIVFSWTSIYAQSAIWRSFRCWVNAEKRGSCIQFQKILLYLSTFICFNHYIRSACTGILLFNFEIPVVNIACTCLWCQL